MKINTRGLKLNYLLVPISVLAVSLIGSLLTTTNLNWYNNISKPSYTPDGSVIGMIWTIIFILVAISILLFSNNPKLDRKSVFFRFVVVLFSLSGILNILWSYLFFELNYILLSVIEMSVLNLVNLILILLLWKDYRKSALLLIPYFLWVLFATYLAYTIYLLN